MADGEGHGFLNFLASFLIPSTYVSLLIVFFLLLLAHLLCGFSLFSFFTNFLMPGVLTSVGYVLLRLGQW